MLGSMPALTSLTREISPSGTYASLSEPKSRKPVTRKERPMADRMTNLITLKRKIGRLSEMFILLPDDTNTEQLKQSIADYQLEWRKLNAGN